MTNLFTFLFKIELVSHAIFSSIDLKQQMNISYVSVIKYYCFTQYVNETNKPYRFRNNVIKMHRVF